MTPAPPPHGQPAGEPLSVLFLNNIAGGGWGGIEKWMLLLAGHLAARGHGVAAAAKPGSRFAAACRRQGLPTAELAMRGDFHPRDLLALRRLYARGGTDLVVLKLPQCIRMAWAAGLIAARPRPAILCRMGDAVVKRGLRARLTYRHMADRYLTPSEHCRRELLRTGYFVPQRIRAIPNGVAIPPPDPSARERVRAELGLGDAPVLIVTSRLHPAKGHVHLLDALALLREQLGGVRLLAVGDGGERPALEERAERLGLGHSVLFTGFRTDVVDLLRAADLFVLPSLLEGMPNTALEAMAVGLPVVASAVDGVPEVVVDGETGLLVSPGDPHLLRDTIGRLLTEPQLAARMGRAGRERVRRHFALDRTLAAAEAWCLATRDSRREP
ncbi:MAG: glycosyltransferase family 4 protein [Candidatus Brocadiia bacterium]